MYSDETVAGTVRGSTDGSDCGPLRYELSGSDAAAFSIGQSSGRVTATGSLSVKTYVMTVKVRDGNGHDSDSATLTIEVTDPPPKPVAPVFGRASYSWAIHDTASAGHVVGTVRATDGNRDRITYVLSDSSRFKVRGSSGVITVAAAPASAGTYKLSAYASDPGGLADTAAVTIKVTTPKPSNRAPTIKSAIPARSVEKGKAVSVVVSPHFSDPDHDALTYSAASSNRSAATVSVKGDTVRVAGVAKGTAEVTVTARDPSDAEVSQKFGVTVSDPPPTNRAPEIESAIAAREVVAGDSVAVRVSPHFSDPDSDALTYSASSSNRN
ncbi:MAG: cadherin repeat domain-containing protein, partial [Gemmatimonadetes bacterium]|nr:cadherin repeat domain-containing protein [Gemmatimonadota bacterium]